MWGPYESLIPLEVHFHKHVDLPIRNTKHSLNIQVDTNSEMVEYENNSE